MCWSGGTAANCLDIPARSICYACSAVKEGRNLRRLGLKVVFVTGEVLFRYQRELICRDVELSGGEWIRRAETAP